MHGVELKSGLLALAIACLAVRGAAQELPSALLEALPRKAASVATVAPLLVERVRQIDDDQQRARVLGSLGGVLPVSPEFDDQLRRIAEQAIDELGEQVHISSLSPLVAHFPELHAKLLARIENPVWRDNIRGVYVIYVAEFELARRICGEINLPVRRRYSLDRLAIHARSVEEMIELLEESIALQPQPDAWTYSGAHLLRKYAAADPRVICDFVARVVPPDQSIYIYTTLAGSANRDNPAAAEMFMDAAWSRIPETTQPFKHVPLLLARDPREVDRATWVAKFDQYVLPVLVDAETGIGPLYELARFDIDLLIDRTRQSCVHPARGFEKIFPQVIEGAFPVNAAAVLAWLETTDSKLKDRCVLEIVQFLSLPEQFKEPSRQAEVDRLCDLTLAIKDPRQRLTALANLSAGLARSDVAVPDRVLAQGQELLRQQADFKTIDLRDKATENFFWLATLNQRKQLIQTQIEKLRAARDYQDRIQLGGVLRSISVSGLPPDEQMTLFCDVVTIAQRYSDWYLQALVASAAVNIDAPWAVKTIWNILPDDRGRSGKRTYIDWTPPPSDAGDAIQWLKRDLQQPEIKVKLLVALWEFLPMAPPVDRDSIRLALSGSLLQHRQFDAALALAEQIESPGQRAEALVAVLAGLKTPP